MRAAIKGDVMGKAEYDPMNPPQDGIPANPLPKELDEGDPDETDRWDDNDTPPESD